MTFILPNKGINIEVEKKLNHEKLKAIFEPNSIQSEVHLYLPRFKLDFKAEVFLIEKNVFLLMIQINNFVSISLKIH